MSALHCGLDNRPRRKKKHSERVRRGQIMPWGGLWVSEHTTVLAGGTCAVVGVAAGVRIGRVIITYRVPCKQDKIDGSVSARAKLVYFELLCP